MFRRESLTRILVIPVGNALGLLLLTLQVSPALLTARMPGTPPRWTAILAPIAAMLVIVIDVLERRRRPDIGLMQRMFSPYEGGTFVILPSWFCAAALMALAGWTVIRGHP